MALEQPENLYKSIQQTNFLKYCDHEYFDYRKTCMSLLPLKHQKTGLGFLMFSGRIDVCVHNSLCGFFQAIPDSKNFKFACSFDGFHLRTTLNLLKCIFYNSNCTYALPFWNMFYIDWLVLVNAKLMLFQFVISNSNIFKKCIKKLMFGIGRWLLEVNLF